jgi:tRNA threonylcarbamoyladenosine biosynthesis protein TsaE
MIYRSAAEEETIAFGEQFAREELLVGDVVALRGELGAGKTKFTKGIAKALGINDSDVSSPTYALLNEYPAIFADERKGHFYHLDCYRFERDDELLELGVEEYLYPTNAITVIEWPERIEKYLPLARIEIAIEHIADTKRTITIHRLTE